MTPPAGAGISARDAVAEALDAARRRTLLLTDLDEPELVRQHDPLPMSPLVWDLAHIGQQEELWLLRDGDGTRPGMLPPQVEELYDAFRQPRAIRDRLPLLPPVEARSFCADVRGRVHDRLERLDASRTVDPDALFACGMVVQHEEQHDETMLPVGLTVRFAAGEQLRTEISTKFRLPALRTELGAAGLPVSHEWTDPAGDFALVLGRPA